MDATPPMVQSLLQVSVCAFSSRIPFSWVYNLIYFGVDFIPERTTPKARRNSSKRTRTSSRSSPKQAKTSSEGQSSPKSNRNSSNTGDDLPQMRTVNNNGTSANGSSVLIRLDTSTSNSSCSSPGPVLDTSSVLRKPASKTTTALITTAPTSTTNDLSSVGASVLASHGLLMTRGSLGVGVGGAGGGGTFSMANQLTPRRPPGFPGPGPRMGLVHQQQQQHYRGLSLISQECCFSKIGPDYEIVSL